MEFNYFLRMDAQMNLKLRRSDRGTNMLRSQHEDQKHVKREHIRDMIVSNFQRRYLNKAKRPTNEQQYEVDKVILNEASNFLLRNPTGINSKELHTFE